MDKHLLKFLLQADRKKVEQQINALTLQLRLPVHLQVIRSCVAQIKVPSAVIQVDPQRQIYLSKLVQLNEQAITKQTLRLFQAFLAMVQLTIEFYKQEQNCRYLGRSYFQKLEREFGIKELQWKVVVQKQLPLWGKLEQEVKQLFGYTVQKICNHFQLHHFEHKELLQAGIGMFEQRLGPQKRQIQKWQKQLQGLNMSLIKVKQTEKSEIDILFQQIQDFQEQIQEKEQIQQIKNHQKESEIHHFIVANDKLFPQKIRKETAEVQKNEERDCKNIQCLITLSQKDRQFIQQISWQDQSSLLELLHYKFNQQQKQRILSALKNIVLQWESEGPYCSGQGQLTNFNRTKINSLQIALSKTVNQILCGQSNSDDKYFILVGLLQQVAKREQYCPLSKKYLMKMMEKLEGFFTTRNYPYLRGALRILQANTINSSQFAKQLSQSLPYLSKRFKSQVDLQNLMLNQKQTIRLQRLSHAKPTKNVAFLISGFLSEDCEKNSEWLGVIRALQQTQLYGVLWKSSTKAELIKYIACLTGNFALEAARKTQLGALFNFVKQGVDFYRRMTGKEVLAQKHQNPFFGALSRAKKAGKELANLLIQHFSDRHITLVGFSMGTEVIAACVKCLIERKKQSILLKVVTMGGIADTNQVQNLLRNAKYPLSWLNFRSKKDYAVRFLYRVCTLGAKPIGAADVRAVKGHQILNWELGRVVSGHMSFRQNLYGLCLMAGLRHD